jgi:hypothetical protein
MMWEERPVPTYHPGEAGVTAMAEEVQLLRLMKAFAKIRNPQTKSEIIELIEAAQESEETRSQ